MVRLWCLLGPHARSESNCISALLSKTSEEVTEVLRKQLETFQILTEISHSTTSLELSVKGNLPNPTVACPRMKTFSWARCMFQGLSFGCVSCKMPLSNFPLTLEILKTYIRAIQNRRGYCRTITKPKNAKRSWTGSRLLIARANTTPFGCHG